MDIYIRYINEYVYIQVACTIEDTHSRAPHTLVQPATSPFVSHGKDAYELFATAAADHTIKMWDVRSARCVRCFTGHKNCQVGRMLDMQLLECHN